MNKLPIIGIVSRFDKDKMNSSLTKNNEIGEYYVKVINKYNGIPVGILPVQDVLYTDLRYDEVPKLTEPGKEKIIKVLELCDGVLLPGGNRWFEYEEFICQYAHDNNIPLLGICQGMQVMGYLSNP
jgi:gamma-glutamyl-gamma-aminobutyrate hydrolase PuuD